MLPTAIEIAGFRSFKEPILIGSLRNLNFFVGQNNSGKSNVLRAITLLSSIRGPDPRLTPKSSDFSPGAERITLYLHFPIRYLKEFFAGRRLNQPDPRLEFVGESDSFAFPFAVDRNGVLSVTDEQAVHFYESIRIGDNVFNALIQENLGFGGHPHLQAKHLLQNLGLDNYLWDKVLFLPQLRTVHTIKQYVDNVDQFIDPKHSIVFSGGQMIDLLFRLQHPPYDARDDKLKFSRIVQFLRDITQNETLSLEVPHDKSSILVTMDGKTLPLHNLGSGIEEILIIAAASLGFEDKIVCIEEPELHIHPLLQKKLVRLLGQTNNLFLITTHSASLIDAEAGSIYDVRMVNGSTQVTNPVSPSEARSALHDLGYRPSDLLQTNSIIWVEGPSDRIYLRKWISIADPALREGVDYSIMFYGGRLLAHLSASDETVGEFIELLRLNRFSSIVIDSDKRSEQSQINDTKRRLVEEVEAHKGVAWVTTGREIENEIQKEVFEEACAKLSKYSPADLDDKYADRLARADDSGKQIDKIRLAREVSVLTLTVPHTAAEYIRKLVDFVKSATFKSV